MNERNHSIDALRIFAACGVIALHVASPSYIISEPLARCAVPLFFMISGYLTATDVRAAMCMGGDKT